MYCSPTNVPGTLWRQPLQKAKEQMMAQAWREGGLVRDEPKVIEEKLKVVHPQL